MTDSRNQIVAKPLVESADNLCSEVRQLRADGDAKHNMAPFRHRTGAASLGNYPALFAHLRSCD